MNQKKLKVGVAGLGFIGPAHIEGIRRIGDEVLGIVGIDLAEAQAKAEELAIEKAYASYDEMIADPEIDIVHVCSPNYLHYSQSVQAIEAGKHVVCEKPLTVTSAESAALVALAKDKRLACAVNYNLRYYPVNYEARATVQKGEIGKIHSIHGSYLQDWLLYPTDWNWRLLPKEGGVLCSVADIGSHWMDMVMFITGLKITEVMADLGTSIPVRKRPIGSVQTFEGKLGESERRYEDVAVTGDDFANLLFHFDNGAKGSLVVSQVSAGRKNRLQYEIDGSQSSIAWDSEKVDMLWRGYRDRYNEVLIKDPSLMHDSARSVASYPGGHTEGFPDTFKQLARKVHNYIRVGDFDAAPDFPTFADGHRALLVEEAILASAQSRQWVPVSL
ncbi:MAG: Gfo/Idh/MocA family oxidoreductase [Chloroflexi bacterium]|nr:Gfo/Idh/MocA family oxidoreductase [Anaerolineaceae bacterium]NMB89489.1 Gfo/Idh/MocA family oxidoreductase [Chloroflexota bacterium]